MKLGRELDMVIAVEIFKWSPHNARLGKGLGGLPYYSNNISDAWLVRKWLIDNVGGVRLERLCDVDKPEFCEVWTQIGRIVIQAETSELAICLAALKAVGVDV